MLKHLLVKLYVVTNRLLTLFVNLYIIEGGVKKG